MCTKYSEAQEMVQTNNYCASGRKKMNGVHGKVCLKVTLEKFYVNNLDL